MELVIFILIIGNLIYLSYKKMDNSIINFIGMVCGIAYAAIYNINLGLVKPIEFYGAFLKVIALIVIIIGVCINSNFIKQEIKQDKLLKKAVVYLFITTIIGALVSIIIGDNTKVGIELLSFGENNLYLLIGLIVVFIYTILNKSKDLYGIRTLITIIQKIMPIAVFINSILLFELNSFNVLGASILFIFSFIICCFVQVTIIHSLLIYITTKKNPIEYFRKLKPAFIFAFKSRSSSKTAPILAKEISKTSYLTPGLVNYYSSELTKVAMNACNGIFPALVTIFTLNIEGRSIGPVEILVVIISVFISSFAMRGLPGISTISTIFALSLLGLPIYGFLLIVAFDYLVDRIRTTVNIISVSSGIKII